MLTNAIRLLHRFALDRSQNLANNKTAILHVIMILSLFVTTIFNDAIMIIIEGVNYYNKEKRLKDFEDWLNAGVIIKNFGQFFAFSILLYMFWSYSILADKHMKCAIKKEEKRRRRE